MELEKIKRISIRARIALCLEALKKAGNKEGIDSPYLDVVYNSIAEFTCSESLDEWDRKITEITPVCLMETSQESEYYESEQIEGIKFLYKSMPTYLTDMINYTIGVGTDNLYGSTGEYSAPSYIATIKVLDLCEQNGIPLPDIEKFTRLSFSEFHGWGKVFNADNV